MISLFVEESRIQSFQENHRTELIVLTKEQEQAKKEILDHFIEKKRCAIARYYWQWQNRNLY